MVTPPCRQHFQKDVRKQLYSSEDDVSFFNRIKDALKSTEARLEEGRVVLQHLEMFLLNVACDDPGAATGTQLVLPMLQERLDGAALAFKAERAKMAEDEIIAMEVRTYSTVAVASSGDPAAYWSGAIYALACRASANIMTWSQASVACCLIV